MLVSSLLVSSAASAASVPGAVKEGNMLYDQKKYTEAIEKYNEALSEAPDSVIAHFNLGAAFYQDGQYDRAAEEFTRALNTEDRKLEAKATFNLGNSKYKLGRLRAEKDLDSAISSYREALDYYKRAMDLNEGDSDPKYNHEFVEKELKILMDRQKKQQQQKRESDDKNNKETSEDKRDQSEGTDNNKENQANQEEEDKTAGRDKMEEGSEQDVKQEDDAANQAEPREMSPEEARMLLDAYGQDEVLDKIKKRGSARYPDVLKDW